MTIHCLFVNNIAQFLKSRLDNLLLVGFYAETHIRFFSCRLVDLTQEFTIAQQLGETQTAAASRFAAASAFPG